MACARQFALTRRIVKKKPIRNPQTYTLGFTRIVRFYLSIAQYILCYNIIGIPRDYTRHSSKIVMLMTVIILMMMMIIII